MTNVAASVQTVKEHYQLYPYPFRTPEDEKRRLVYPILDCPEMLNHYCYGGRRDIMDGMRVLVAGGGTGDSAIYMAELMRHGKGEVVYVDLSETSLKIAQERAQIRGLTNIRWHLASLLEVGNMGLGTFDYINCSGVLHHLPDPDAGLRALANVLKDDGAMAVMLYGTYGRMEIYLMQDALRLLNEGETSLKARVDNAKALMSCLPRSNMFAQMFARWKHEVEMGGDSGIYDLLLHSQDRPYTVPQVYSFAEQAGLNVVEFFDVPGARWFYKPEIYLQAKPALAERVKALPKPLRYAIAEALHGNMSKQSFYLSRQQPTPPVFADLDMVPLFLQDLIKGADMARSLRSQDKPLKMIKPMPGLQMELNLAPRVADVVEHIDGRRSFGDIFNIVRAMPAHKANPPTDATLFDELRVLYEPLNDLDLMLLRHKSVQRPPSAEEMQKPHWLKAMREHKR